MKVTMIKTRPKRKTRRPSWIRLDHQALDSVRKALRWSAAFACGPHENQEGADLVAHLVRLRCDLALSRLEAAERAAECSSDAASRKPPAKTRKTVSVAN
jgi:hypothetical protein